MAAATSSRQLPRTDLRRRVGLSDRRPAKLIAFLLAGAIVMLGIIAALCSKCTKPREGALDAAHKGLPRWAATPAHERVAILRRFGDQLAVRREELATLLCRENGKPIGQAVNEINGAARLFRAYAEEALRLYGLAVMGDVQPGMERDLMLTRHEPLGVIGAILPFNFPANLFSHKVAPALATGNVVVLKPAEEAPLTVLRLAELLYEAGLPPFALQIVTGRGARVGAYLAASPRIQAISFTGSTEVGVAVAQGATRHLSRVFLELGGNDPMVVFADADLDLVVEQALSSRLVANGQCCCATKRIVAHRSVAGAIAEALAGRLAQVRVGDPFDPAVAVGPLITAKAARRAADQVRLSCEQGGTLRFGKAEADRAFLPPVVLSDVPPSADVARDLEIFAPVLPIIAFDTDPEAIRIANDTRYGLNASVFTRSMGKAVDTANRIQAGIVVINGGSLYRPDFAPFGGVKMSGLGREGTTVSLREFTHAKTIAFRNIMSPPTAEAA